MYTAVINYEFKEGTFDKACEIWKNEVLEVAKNQEGFIRMQFLTRENQAMAIGTWKSPEFAQAFMRTGVFKTILDKFEKMLVSKPNPVIWETKYYSES